jgi:hypothetical protein
MEWRELPGTGERAWKIKCRESEQDNEEAGACEKEKESRQTKVDEHWNTFYPLNAVEY